MPAYHSQFNEGEYRAVGNMYLLPLKTRTRGPAPVINDTSMEDVVDEALSLYRANCFFRNYEIHGPGDRTLIYAILFVGECLAKIGSMVKGENYPSLSEANSNFSLPGDGNFPLNALYDKPKDRTESDLMRGYLAQIRQEISIRLPEKLYSSSYPDTDGGKKPTKWWLSFHKRKFMNKSL